MSDIDGPILRESNHPFSNMHHETSIQEDFVSSYRYYLDFAFLVIYLTLYSLTFKFLVAFVFSISITMAIDHKIAKPFCYRFLSRRLASNPRKLQNWYRGIFEKNSIKMYKNRHVVCRESFSEDQTEYKLVAREHEEANLRMIDVYFRANVNYNSLSMDDENHTHIATFFSIIDEGAGLPQHFAVQEAVPSYRSREESVRYAVEKVKEVSGPNTNRTINEAKSRMDMASEAIPSHMDTSEFKPEDNECPSCNSSFSESEFNQNGENPQVGYEYFDCSKCGELTPKSKVN